MTRPASAPVTVISGKSAALGLALLAPAPTIGVWFAAFASTDSAGALVWTLAKVWLLAGPLLWWTLVQRQRPTVPVPDAPSLRWGGASGLILCGVIIAAYWLIGRRAIDFSGLSALMASLSLDTVPRYVALVAYLTLINSLIEEYVFRWFMQTQLRRLLPDALAVVLSALIFTLHHTVVLSAYIPGLFNALASLGVFAGALIWSWLYYRTGNLWTAYISHIGADIGVFLVGYHALFVI